MPSPARLVAALLMAVVGWMGAEAVVIFALPDWVSPGRLHWIAAGLGLIVGWRILGRVASGPIGKGDRLMVGMTGGLGAVLVVVLGTIVVHAVLETYDDAVRLAFSGPGDALAGMAQVVVDDVVLLMEPRALAVILGGGAIAGLAAGIAGRIWW